MSKKSKDDKLEKIKVFIDKETGILLKYITLDKEDKIVSSMETTKIEINSDIDYSIFEKTTDGYEKDIR